MFSLHYSRRKRGFYLFLGDRRVARLPLVLKVGEVRALLDAVNADLWERQGSPVTERAA